MSHHPIKHDLDVRGNIIITGTVDGVDISDFKEQFDKIPKKLNDLTDHEIDQIININNSVFESDQFERLSKIDQDLKKEDSVEFNSIKSKTVIELDNLEPNEIDFNNFPSTSGFVFKKPGSNGLWYKPSPNSEEMNLLTENIITNKIISYTTKVSTTFKFYNCIKGMLCIPEEGKYSISFSGNAYIDSRELGQEYCYALFKNGNIIKHSERRSKLINRKTYQSLHTQDIIKMNGSDLIEVRYKISKGIFRIDNRSLTFIKLG